MKKIGKFLLRGLSVIVILVLILVAGGAYYFKSYLPNTVAPKSFPKIDGEIQLEGLNGPVNIYRDKMGIPHIYAATAHDLFFAQGYVHAQERFWQMDFYRHVGTLADARFDVRRGVFRRDHGIVHFRDPRQVEAAREPVRRPVRGVGAARAVDHRRAPFADDSRAAAVCRQQARGGEIAAGGQQPFGVVERLVERREPLAVAVRR